MKYILRQAFKDDISDELLWRPKKTFQVGCHTDYLKNEEPRMYRLFQDLYVNGTGYDDFIDTHDIKIKKKLDIV